jgi:hypothetical protein
MMVTVFTTASGKQTISREQPRYLSQPWWYVRRTGSPQEDNRFLTAEEALAWAEEREVPRLIVEVQQGRGVPLGGMTLSEAMQERNGVRVFVDTGLSFVGWATGQYTVDADGRLVLWRAYWDSSG